MHINKEFLQLMQVTHKMINNNDYAAQLKDLFKKVSELNQIYGEDRPIYLSKEQYKMLEKLLADNCMFYSKDEFDLSKGMLATYNGVRIVVEDF